jgi:uncharacterized repeat protein (TIGR01451 family)
LVGAQAHLVLTQTGPTGAVAGQTVTYAIVVKNTGPSAAANVTITDTLPADTFFVSASGAPNNGSYGSQGPVTFTLSRASLAEGSTAKVSLVVATDPTATSSTTLVNTATASSTTTDPNPTQDSQTVYTPLNLSGGSLGTSALNPAKTDMVIGTPTTGNSSIIITQSGKVVTAYLNGQVVAQGTPTGRIVVYGHGGAKTTMTVLATTTVPVWEYGGAGTNNLYGGNGNDVLVGGSFKNSLSAGGGFNMEIADTGTSTLTGGTGQDIMVGGVTTWDSPSLANQAALAKIMSQWTNGQSYAARVSQVASLLFPAVSESGVSDTLMGGSGGNLYFASAADKVIGMRNTETLYQI